MLAQKTDQSRVDRYVSDRVYDGVRQVSKQDAAVNRRAMDDAFSRMEHDVEHEGVARVAS